MFLIKFCGLYLLGILYKQMYDFQCYDVGLQLLTFKKAIEDMASCSLRCVAIAYRTYERERVPDEEELSRWALPEDDLVLLAIVGIKV